MEALCDGGGIDEEPATQTAANVRVELVERKTGLQGGKREREREMRTYENSSIHHNVCVYAVRFLGSRVASFHSAK